MSKFNLYSDYKPLGDQPKAIKSLVEHYKDGIKEQTLEGEQVLENFYNGKCY